MKEEEIRPRSHRLKSDFKSQNKTMKRCKILFVHQVGCRGGAGTMLANIITAIDKRKFEPIVICPDGDVVEQLRDAGAEVRISTHPIYQFSHYTGYSRFALHPSFIRNAYRIWRDRGLWEGYIRNSGAEIVCLNAMTLAPMARAGRRAGAGVMCIVQETTVSGSFGLRTSWIYYVLSNWMDAVVFISQFDRNKSHCQAPIVEVVPNWVDLTVFDRSYPSERARSELEIPQTSNVVLMMGGIDKLKGTLPLIQAVSMLQNVNGLLVIIAGYSDPLDINSFGFFQRFRFMLRRFFCTEYRQKVMHTITEWKLGERVRFVGMQSNITRLYAAADVIVFPATKPHQARPVLEAGAMAKPVIVPDFPQTREFVRNGVNGLTYRPGDTKDLAQAIEMMLTAKELAHRMGENNYLRTCENHNGALNAVKINHVFEKLAGKLNNVTL